MERLQGNLDRYSRYRALTWAMFWGPVGLLYFETLVGLERALELQFVYYLAVVVLEVPSGAFSDRLGRRLTLGIAALAGTLAHLVFASATEGRHLVLGQILLATWWGFNSGTDASFHYDALRAVGRSPEYMARESRIQGRSLMILGLSSLAGGALSLVSYRLAYGASALACLGAFSQVLRMQEPPRAPPDPAGSGGPPGEPDRGPSLRTLLASGPILAVFAYTVVMTVLAHVPSELGQAWLKEVLAKEAVRPGQDVTPMVSGALQCLVLLVSGQVCVRLSRHLDPERTPATLIATVILVTGIIAVMAASPTPAALPVLLLRGIPWGVGEPVALAWIQPRLPDGMRATWLSIQSLAGRLAYGGTLLVAARALQTRGLSAVLTAYTLGGGVAILVLAVVFARTSRS